MGEQFSNRISAAFSIIYITIVSAATIKIFHRIDKHELNGVIKTYNRISSEKGCTMACLLTLELRCISFSYDAVTMICNTSTRLTTPTEIFTTPATVFSMYIQGKCCDGGFLMI